MNRGCSDHLISAAVYGIKWVHSFNIFQDPRGNHFVKNLVESAKHNLSRPVDKKQPVTKDILNGLCSKYESTTDVLILRDLCMILLGLGFSAFLRFDELRNLHCNDITFHDDYVSLHIRKSKTDQYRHGSNAVVAISNTITCPYMMLRRCFVAVIIISSASSHFFSSHVSDRVVFLNSFTKINRLVSQELGKRFYIDCVK